MKRLFAQVVILVGVALVSFCAALTLPTTEILKGIIALPAVGALIAVLYQVFRDEASHRKNIEIQNSQQIFSLGAMSHMANTAFDKHAEFCTKYMAEVHETIVTLFREGPTPEALRHAANLSELRRDYAAWITNEISSELVPFERELSTLGATEGLSRDTRGTGMDAGRRQDLVGRVWEHFNRIMTLDDAVPDENVAVEAVKSKIRKIIGIDELVQIRTEVVRRAVASLKDNDAVI